MCMASVKKWRGAILLCDSADYWLFRDAIFQRVCLMISFAVWI